MTTELNCSDGAKMLVERMQTNPKEFWGSGSKWATILNQAFSRVRGTSETHMVLTERDAIALTTAYDRYIREPMLAELVFTHVMAPEPERKRVNVTPRPPGKSITPLAYEEFLHNRGLWNGDPYSYEHLPDKDHK